MTAADEKKHCDHECVCSPYRIIVGKTYGKDDATCVRKNCIHDTRARGPVEAISSERYTGTCTFQDKCNDYSDFLESIDDKLDPDDEDPPCPIKCDFRQSPLAAHDAEVAARVREEVLKIFRPLDKFFEGVPEDTIRSWAISKQDSFVTNAIAVYLVAKSLRPEVKK